MSFSFFSIRVDDDSGEVSSEAATMSEDNTNKSSTTGGGSKGGNTPTPTESGKKKGPHLDYWRKFRCKERE